MSNVCRNNYFILNKAIDRNSIKVNDMYIHYGSRGLDSVVFTIKDFKALFRVLSFKYFGFTVINLKNLVTLDSLSIRKKTINVTTTKTKYFKIGDKLNSIHYIQYINNQLNTRQLLSKFNSLIKESFIINYSIYEYYLATKNHKEFIKHLLPTIRDYRLSVNILNLLNLNISL